MHAKFGASKFHGFGVMEETDGRTYTDTLVSRKKVKNEMFNSKWNHKAKQLKCNQYTVTKWVFGANINNNIFHLQRHNLEQIGIEFSASGYFSCE